ncbi:DNA glycosylase [Podospora didyma]|uniref:Endonuclease III homolog n=1 Tax=Podospora didyma TaxID=330526 RepID=A0AAE0KLE4_9PEZI|nr:DNA glycosylase [Podospora didyma]
MRTSRVARETSGFFDTASSPTTTALPRRSTRSSTSLAARFAYSSTVKHESTDVDEDEDEDEKITYGSDIEDSIKSSKSPPPHSVTGDARKRKRTTTVIKRELAQSTVALRGAKKEEETTSDESKKKIKREPVAKAVRGDRKVKAEPRRIVKAETKINTELYKASESESEAQDLESILRKPASSRARKPARRALDAVTGEITVQPPSDWEEMYDLVKAMRISGPAANAAVDTMGCERLADPSANARDRRFHTLVALMLSSQTKDTVNAEAMARLQTELPPHREGVAPGLTLENMLAVEPAVLNELIYKVGFHNNKTKYLKQAAVILRDQYNSDIPPTIEGLMSLPGVGPKMAHLCMSAEHGWNTTLGIGVDVHVHRITNLWGWQNPPSKNPEMTRLALQSWLPRERWKEINWLLVGLGQKVCLPVGRKCGECELGLRGLCKAADRKKVIEGMKRRDLLVKEEVKYKMDGEDVVMEEEEKVVIKKEKEKVIKREVEQEEEEMIALGDVSANEEEDISLSPTKKEERAADIDNEVKIKAGSSDLEHADVNENKSTSDVVEGPSRVKIKAGSPDEDHVDSKIKLSIEFDDAKTKLDSSTPSAEPEGGAGRKVKVKLEETPAKEEDKKVKLESEEVKVKKEEEDEERGRRTRGHRDRLAARRQR